MSSTNKKAAPNSKSGKAATDAGDQEEEADDAEPEVVEIEDSEVAEIEEEAEEEDENEDDIDIDEAPLLIFKGRRRQYSKSSTVHTAPLTFSTRMKHLCKLRLCLTAF